MEPAKFGQQSRESWLEHEPARGQWTSPGCISFRSFPSLCPGNCAGPYDLHDLYPGSSSTHSRMPQRVNMQTAHLQAKGASPSTSVSKDNKQNRTQLSNGGCKVSCLWVLGHSNPAHNHLLGKSSDYSEFSHSKHQITY